MDRYSIPYFDRDGTPISLDRWLELMALPSYRTVLRTELEGGAVLSTVWLGAAVEPGAPLIFESMFFAPGHPLDQIAYRSATEVDAALEHAQLLTLWQMENALLP